MGVCCSEESDYSPSNDHKILLVGPAASGKSTLCKQLLLRYGTGFTEADTKAFTKIIRVRTLEYMQQLIIESKRLPKYFSEETGKEVGWTKEAGDLATLILRQDPYVENINLLSGIDDLGGKIEKLWKEPVITAAYHRQSLFQEKINENAGYFLDKVLDISAKDYAPSTEDILRCRQRTVGHEELKFTLSEVDFCILDLGGQWDERRNWEPFLRKADSLLFVADTGAYDEFLQEDSKRNRMEDSLALFERICDLKITRKKPIVLFLNKMDIFTKKIKRVPITVCDAFKSYDGPHDSEEDAKLYISEKFSKKNMYNRTLMKHYLCALDTEAVNKIFQSTLISVLQTTLEEGGLIS
mmetsp:Transcript_16468/g.23006  ORF Transcript_16468/g.23006 Transcript_16468/m.23006 type:complete len:354 (-) Transcript_16468:241-1302(-)|eukprot:CAMPEP_0184493270 /NCGR_PEP_ID=MMETSP0113_2-20130426/25525_1 /TAXON_ID=91329 /ORGANISM="Norrisiella sphaerica, Strain BC52" /LENGTH=353 /DNA_ID=CAMNT_0026878473 /DNA_START=194 /DNA_END=1255 /DNA_ORIENTATION=+